jgi:TolB protein
MRNRIRAFAFLAVAFSPFLLGLQTAPPSQPQQPSGSDWYFRLKSPGRPVYLALPDFEVRGATAANVAKTLASVTWSDMDFASVYRLVPKDRYRLITGPVTPTQVDYYQWESIGSDILVLGTAEIQMDKLVSEVRIYATKAQQMVFGNRYEGKPEAARAMAHRIADDILLQAGNYRGVARTKVAYTSDRRGEQSKELYLMDYDGYGQRPLTANRSLNLTPSWSPDGRALAYISYRSGRPDLYRAFIYEGRGDHLVAGPGMSFTPAWSPDGSRIAFTSTKDGNSEIYLINADGTGLQRLTNHRSIDTSPCWSPNGREIAFTSDRTGAPQIYVMGADGLNTRRISFDGSYNDAPAWSPSREFSEIAWSSRIERGPFDIVVYNFQTQQVRQLTTGRGSNESPNWSPNGLHLVFSSDRTGSTQVYSMNRDGSNVRRLTRQGNNTTPKWGPIPGGRP